MQATFNKLHESYELYPGQRGYDRQYHSPRRIILNEKLVHYVILNGLVKYADLTQIMITEKKKKI